MGDQERPAGDTASERWVGEHIHGRLVDLGVEHGEPSPLRPLLLGRLDYYRSRRSQPLGNWLVSDMPSISSSISQRPSRSAAIHASMASIGDPA